MTELEMGLTLVVVLSLLGMVFAMVESNQQKRSARSLNQELTYRLDRAHQILEELQNTTQSKDTIIDSLLEQRDAAETKAIELTQLLNNNQEYILALEDKAIAKKTAEKKVKAPAKKPAPKKSKKG